MLTSLDSTSSCNVSYNKTTASTDLQEKIRECVREENWLELSATIDGNPEARLDAVEVDLHLDGSMERVSLLWLSAWEERWRITKKLLNFNSSADIDGGMPKRLFPRGRSVLWLVIHEEKWKLANSIIDRFPHVDLDATGLEGLGAGINILWLAAVEGKWKLVNKILKLNPKVNVHAISANGDYKGANVAFLAAFHGNFALLAKLLDHSPTLDCNAALPSSKAKTTLWYTARAGQWELVGKLLNGNPQYILKADFLNGRPEGSALLENSLSVRDVPVAFCSYLLGARLSECTPEQKGIIKGIEKEVDTLFARVILFRNGVGVNHATNLFSKLPLELQNKCLLDAIKVDRPPISSLPAHILIQIVDCKAKQKYSVYQQKAKQCIATLAFQALRYNNGLIFHPFTKSSIIDFKNMLLQSLDNYDIDYTYDIRQKVIAKIGKKRSNALTIKPSDIHAAIRAAIRASIT